MGNREVWHRMDVSIPRLMHLAASAGRGLRPWVQLDAAGKPGGGLTAEMAGQYRPADQYLDGWTRDFFTVLAAPARSGGRAVPGR